MWRIRTDQGQCPCLCLPWWWNIGTAEVEFMVVTFWRVRARVLGKRGDYMVGVCRGSAEWYDFCGKVGTWLLFPSSFYHFDIPPGSCKPKMNFIEATYFMYKGTNWSNLIGSSQVASLSNKIEQNCYEATCKLRQSLRPSAKKWQIFSIFGLEYFCFCGGKEGKERRKREKKKRENEEKERRRRE